MLLAIDIGNSTSRFGVHDGDTWIGHWRLRTVPERMPDEYSVLFDGLLGQVGLDLSGVETAAVASSVPPVTGMVSQMLFSVFMSAAARWTEASQSPLNISMYSGLSKA